jgi:hypothetical protein
MERSIVHKLAMAHMNEKGSAGGRTNWDGLIFRLALILCGAKMLVVQVSCAEPIVSLSSDLRSTGSLPEPVFFWLKKRADAPVFTLDEGDVAIEFPKDLSKASVEDLAAYLKTHLWIDCDGTQKPDDEAANWGDLASADFPIQACPGSNAVYTAPDALNVTVDLVIIGAGFLHD